MDAVVQQQHPVGPDGRSDARLSDVCAWLGVGEQAEQGEWLERPRGLPSARTVWAGRSDLQRQAGGTVKQAQAALLRTHR